MPHFTRLSLCPPSLCVEVVFVHVRTPVPFRNATLQIAVFFLIYYLAQGCLIPYLPPYYKSLGLSGSELSMLSSIAPFIMIFAPPVWGFLSDRSGRPVRTLQIAMAGSALLFLPLFAVHSGAGLAAVLACQALFATAITSLADTVTVAEALRLNTDYGRLRVAGSLGYVVGAYGFGAALAGGYGLNHVLWIGAIGLAFAAVSTLALPQSKPVTAHQAPSFREAAQLLHNGAFVAFLITGMLHWAALQSYYLLYALRIEELNVSPQFVGIGIAAGIATEVALMWSFRNLLQRLPLLPFLALSIVSSILRWSLTAWFSSGAAVAAMQALHGLTLGGFYVGSIAYLEQSIPPPLRATGRALLASISLGLGAVLGNLIAGRLLDYGGTSAGYYGAAGLDILALIPLAACALLATSRRIKVVPR